METIGRKVTTLKPSKAFSAELSATFVILLATRMGIPISTTHASVGAVMGVGIAEDGWRKGVQWGVMVNVFASWVLTIPFVAMMTGGIYLGVALVARFREFKLTHTEGL
jgi:phosphate/sulfate permease